MTPDDLEKQLQKYKRAVDVAKEALKKLNNPDEDPINGMIIGDMGLDHFMKYSAKKVLTEIDKILGDANARND